MQNLESEHCKGCRDVPTCPFEFISDELVLSCPCGICLIKGMCQTACDIYDQFSECNAEGVKLKKHAYEGLGDN